MVNITHKLSTLRQAVALAEVTVSHAATIEAIVNKRVPKGDVFEFSRAAGLFACKKTYEVIPDCHPLPIEFTAITHSIEGLKIIIRVEVHTVYKTGVEVEAMHGAAITALTMYDMLKPIDKGIEISNIRLEHKKGGKTDFKYAIPETLKIALITCSDSISKGINNDETGTVIKNKLAAIGLDVQYQNTIPDEFDRIQQELITLTAEEYELILFTGGTGLSARDVTPDAISMLIDRAVPGIMEAARNYGQQRTPYAMLSRGVAGFRQNSLIITLPGSPKGAAETMDAIFPHILHVFKVKEGVRHD
jgi:molybdenum cofactor biosynthesis protein MoaC